MKNHEEPTGQNVGNRTRAEAKAEAEALPEDVVYYAAVRMYFDLLTPESVPQANIMDTFQQYAEKHGV